jgi:hypothetical protein
MVEKEETKLSEWTEVRKEWELKKPKTIRSASLTELKSYKNPSEGTIKVCIGVSWLIGEPCKNWSEFTANVLKLTG